MASWVWGLFRLLLALVLAKKLQVSSKGERGGGGPGMSALWGLWFLLFAGRGSLGLEDQGWRVGLGARPTASGGTQLELGLRPVVLGTEADSGGL